MSAIAQSPNVFRALRRRLNEQEAILTIGHAALTAANASGGLETVANVALRLTGVHGVQVRLHVAQEETQLLEWGRSRVSLPYGTATGLMVANSREWGQLRLLFEPRIHSVECPLRFARIMAQQAALMLNRLELLGRHQSVRAAVRRLQERLDTRKAVSRAAGILAQTKQMTHQRAVLLLLKQAREKRRSPLQLARTIILGDATGHFAAVSLRRLRPEEMTSAPASNLT